MKLKTAVVLTFLFLTVGLSTTTLSATDIDVDPNVILISSGQISWVSPEEGFRFRFVAVLSEVYLTLYIQRIDYGEEGCCAKVSKTYELNKEKIETNLFDVSNIKWLTVDSFTFRGNSTYYKVSKLNDKYRIEKLSAK